MLTGTHSEAASYEFTTLTCIPGIIHYNDTKIQLLDLPGIIEGASEGKGRGRQVSKSSKICSTTWSGYPVRQNEMKFIHNLFQFCQVIAVSKSSDIVLMVLDASKVSFSSTSC